MVQNPVMLLGDGMISQMMEPVDLIQREPRYQQKKDWATTGWEDKSKRVINSCTMSRKRWRS